MYDVATSQEIGNSGSAYIFPDMRDTTVVLGLELPPSHYPSATVKIDLEVKNGVFAAQNTALAIVINKFAVDAVPKQRVREESAHKTSPGFDLTISPNPATDAFTIQYRSDSDRPTDVAVFDLLGRNIHEVHGLTTKPGLNSANVKLNDQQPGVYHLVVTNGVQRQVGRLTIIDK